MDEKIGKTSALKDVKSESINECNERGKELIRKINGKMKPWLKISRSSAMWAYWCVIEAIRDVFLCDTKEARRIYREMFVEK